MAQAVGRAPMRSGRRVLGAVCAGVGLMMSHLTRASETVSVDPEARYQVMRGWGTSLCWWANVVGGWEDDKRNAIADLLFDPGKGIGLNLVRYNIGGGDDPSHTHHRAGGAVPGFRAGADAPYDWTADANQRWVLQAAAARGADVVEAFSNSPPWWMTTSGCSSGAKDPERDNLREESYEAFATYLVDVVEHYRREWGITFGTLDPCNEPGGNWWKAEKGQEGCRFGTSAQARIIKAVAATLKSRGLTTEVSAMDAHSIDWALSHVKAYDDEAKVAFKQLNVHAYKGEYRAEVRNLAESLGKRLWMSEVDHAGRVGEKGHDHESMAPPLKLAEAIIRDLRVLQPEAWVFWQAVENEQYCIWWKFNYGLLHGDFMHGTESYHLTKKYHAMGQFSKFIRPGAQMIGIDVEDTVAFVDWGEGALALVAVNGAEEPRERTYDLSAFRTVAGAVGAYRTAPGEDLVRLTDPAVGKGRLAVTEPGTSITTYVLQGVSHRGVLKLNDTVQGDGPNRFEFVGEWAFKGREPRAFTCDNHWGWRRDDHYLVHFRGTQVKLYGAKDKSAGIAAISLDGGPETLVDLYSRDRQDQALMFASPVLPVGDHVVKVRVTGDKHPDATHPVVAADRADVWE